MPREGSVVKNVRAVTAGTRGPQGLGREAVFSRHFEVTSLIFTRAL